MAGNGVSLYSGHHLIPIYKRTGFCEERKLSIDIFDFGDQLEIKLRDLSEYSFNYTEYINLNDFEVMRIKQSLDINYPEFKTNIVDLLHQFVQKEMFLKCQMNDVGCTLIFFTKTKIKSIVYLTLDLHVTDQKKIIAEMYKEMNNLQDVNEKLQKQLVKAHKVVENKESQILDLEITRNLILDQFFKNLQQIEKIFSTKLTQTQASVMNRISSHKTQISKLHRNLEILKQQHTLKRDSSDRLIRTMESLKLENMENAKSIEDLQKEIASLNILKVSLERNVEDLKRSLENVEISNKNLERNKSKLEKDLETLSIVVTQKESKISELSKDLVQANNMLVQFNSHFDTKVQQVEELQEALRLKEKLLNEQKCQTQELLKTFEEYKAKCNIEKFKSLEQQLFSSEKRIQDLEEEIRKLNKINAILTQKLSHGYFVPK
ncbi:hypothetical protein ABEB36_006589 [Hypothenemus hampei]|uniref:Spindle assembly abnormal protein 6 N-terminal domain-containing protein n=1 Tax=Hypothenemus hampei TaxID=57062 RepID=A0ABD1ETA7_HYPHA